MRKILENIRSSLWFVPAILVLAAILVAIVLIIVDAHFGNEVLSRWPWLIGSSAEGARKILSAIASSMITVAGVTFSMTIVALSLASNQYSPRILRNYMRDRSNQVVLGIFVSIFIYCLIVLRAIRGGEEAFVPSLSVLFAILFALASIAFLIYFIHHIATSIQACSIISSVSNETIDAIMSLFPEELGENQEMRHIKEEDDSKTEWKIVPSFATGYIQSVHPDLLVKFAEENECVLRMEKGIGEFIIKGTPLISISGFGNFKSEYAHKLNTFFVVNSYRTVDQDAAFGIRQIVDIALKALSPGINDTTTATICVDYLGAILYCLASRHIPSPYRYSKNFLRVISRGPTFEKLVDESFDEIRRSATTNVTVILKILNTIETIAATHRRNDERRQIFSRHTELIEKSAENIESEYDKALIKFHIARVSQLMQKHRIHGAQKEQ